MPFAWCYVASIMMNAILKPEIHNAYRSLAASILHEAIMDWKKYRVSKSTSLLVRNMGFKTYRTELLSFFHSPLFENLATSLDIEPSVIRAELKIS